MAQAQAAVPSLTDGDAGKQDISVTTPQSAADEGRQVTPRAETSEGWNRRISELLASKPGASPVAFQEDRIGPEDILDINVFAAPDLNRQVRVSTSGEISLPLVGDVRAAGLTPRELQAVLEELLRPKYINDPHVSVFVQEIQSHPVSVIGAVRKPGVFQIRGGKTLLEVLSLAEGIADDAGENVVIIRGGAPENEPVALSANLTALPGSPLIGPPAGQTVRTTAPGPSLDQHAAPTERVVQVNLRDLLESADLSGNPVIYPGDIVKVTRAGIVYVIGEVERPGGFTMKTNQGMSVIQAIALSGGLTRTAAKSGVRIIHTDESGRRSETPVDIGKVIADKNPDPILTAGDIVYVRNSAAKTAFSRGVEGAAQTLTGLLIFHW